MKIRLKDAEDLNRLLLMNGFTQRSLSKHIGISAPHGHLVLSGKRNPGPKIAKDIHEALNVAFDDIFFIECVNKSKQS